MRRTPLVWVVVVLGVAGCSDEGRPPPSAECTAGAAEVTRALDAAPGDVRLVDGTPLSECVRNAESDAELQNLGLVFTRVAEDLEADASEDPRAALRLGYLVGAARRGSPSESSLQAELVLRLESSASVELPPEEQRALAEGMRAGERGG
jgi:hypothetical protein